jgi:hypothetical protein
MPFVVHAHVKPCTMTDGKAMQLDLQCSGGDTMGDLRGRIAEASRLPANLLVLFAPSRPEHASAAAHVVADSVNVYEALKAHDGKPHRVDVCVDESGKPEITGGEVFQDAGKGDVDSRIRYGGHGGHGGLGGHAGAPGPARHAK